jgi:hypothetical protein
MLMAKVIKMRPEGVWPLSGLPRSSYLLGFWAAVLTTVAILAFDLTAGLGAVIDMPLVAVLGSAFMIAPPFLVLMSVVHQSTGEHQRVWTQAGLAFAAAYSAIISINYILMLTVVRASPQALPAFTMEFRSDSAFWALEMLAYAFMGLAALFVVPVLTGTRVKRAIGGLFIINAAVTLLAAAAYLITLNVVHPLVVASLVVWGIAFPSATGLLAWIFWRAAKP